MTEDLMTRGTVQREHIYVRGTCEQCGESDTLVYELDAKLICAEDYRKAVRNLKFITACDQCGATPSFRDPAHRRNEYLCAGCHSKNDFNTNNTVVKRVLVQIFKGLPGSKVRCLGESADSPCDDNIKPRGAWGGKSLCNVHGRIPPKPIRDTKS